MKRDSAGPGHCGGRLTGLICMLAILAGGCTSHSAASQSTASFHPFDSPDWWKLTTLPLHGEQIASDDSFAVIVPRNDIDLESDMGQIPTSAGIASRFYFFSCPCREVKLVGDFLARDDETQDVLDAFGAGKFTVVSVSPILRDTWPKLVSIRFQAQGNGDDLVQTLRDALDRVNRRSATRRDD